MNDALENHDNDIAGLKEKRRRAKLALEDLEEEQANLQKTIHETILKQARLQSEVKVVSSYSTIIYRMLNFPRPKKSALLNVRI